MQIRTRTGVDAHDAIIDAARQVLHVEGAGGLTIPRVARQLSVTRPAVYHHFSSVEALRDAVLRPVLEDGERLVRENQGDKARLATGVINFAFRHRAVIRSCFTETPPSPHSQIDLEFAALRRDLDAALRPRTPAEDGSQRTAMFFAACAAAVVTADSPLTPRTQLALIALLDD
jgi:AcrR family transcriptional regulator